MQSEDDIKRAFLPFLKEFYKYRYEYQPGSVHSELDNISAGGLVADGMVSFRKSDGAPFVCTYEATSSDKIEEVKFALNVWYFTWDCLAFGAFVAAAAYTAAYVTRLPWLVGLQGTGNAGFVLGMGIIGFFTWYFLLRKWRKYRYIYAVEQFKQYFADEQWIALAEDVFPAPTDPYLIELKSQCVYNGFGLAIVPERDDVRVLITPSRLGMYGKDRRMVHWVTRLEWYQSMSQNVNTLNRYLPALPGDVTQSWNQFWNKLWRPVQYLLIEPVRRNVWDAFSRPLGRTNSSFDRYMQSHGVQKWVFTLSLMALIPLAYRVLTIREDDVREVVKFPKVNPEDQYGYLYEGDRLPARDPRGIPKQYPNPVSRTAAEDNVPTINLSRSGIEDDETPTINLSRSGIEDDEVPTINLSGDGADAKDARTPRPAPDANDPCAGWRRQKGWIIQDNIFISRVLAEERVAAVRWQGISSEIIPKICLGDQTAGYVVRIGSTSSTEAAAVAQANNLSNALQRYGLWQNELSIRRLN